MKTLLETLRNHDWYYMYSDDHRVWKRGRARQDELKKRVDGLNSPYTLSELRRAVQDQVFEDFAEEEPGQWYRQPRKYKNIAPTQRGELMHRADQVQILAWIERQG
tara:strand:+ start:4145 stop:4462 length:318 start_codon:yes stop_codon:yes gene_type:complete